MAHHLFNKTNAPVFLAFFMLVAAVIVTLMTSPEEKINGQLLFPDMQKIMPEVVAINLDKGVEPLTLVKNGEGDWFIGEMDAYPADKAKVERLIRQFSEFRVEDIVTSNPSAFARLGVEEPSEAAATLRVSFVDLGGKMPVSLIIGARAGDNTFYARKDGSLQVYVVKGAFDYEPEPSFWADAKLISVDSAQIVKITLTDLQTKPAEELVYSRTKGGEAFSYKANFKIKEPILISDAERIAGGFANISFIRARLLETFNEKDVKTVFKTEAETANGDIYTVNFVKVGKDDLWVEVLSSAPEINKKTEGWLYQLPLKQILNLLPPPEMAKE